MASPQVSTETVYPAAGGADSVNLKYDKDGMMSQVGALKLAYAGGNNLLLSDTLGGAITNYTYSTFGEMASKEVKFGATTLFRLDYSRDSLGRIIQKQETQQGVVQKHNYAYDVAGRLKDVWRNDTLVASYAYDANGNRLVMSTPSGVDSGRYDAQDRLLRYGNASYVYSENGDLRLKIEPAGGGDGTDTTRYVYDAFGSLISVTLPNGMLIQYLLDGNGLRIGRRVNGAVTHKWIYSNNLRIVAETDSANNITSRFVYTTSENVPEYMVKAGVVYRIVTDQVGSVVQVLNSQMGEIVQQANYDEFGSVILDTNPGFVPFGFSGGVCDRGTKMLRFGVRDYGGNVGRWITKDPLGFDSGDENLYGYLKNAPIDKADASGLFAGTASLVQADRFNQAAYLTGMAMFSAIGAEIIGAILGQAIMSMSISFEISASNFFSKETRKSGQEKGSDIPSWAKGVRPQPGESGKDVAKRLLDDKYGSGNYGTGPGSEYNKIKKFIDRMFKDIRPSF